VRLVSKYFTLFFIALLFSSIISFYFFININRLNNLVINEVVTKNTNVAFDEDGYYSNWIEIWNPTNNEISTEGLSLSLNGQEWNLPIFIVEPDEIFLVWVSGKNKTSGPDEMHTNFLFSENNSELKLISADSARILDKISIPTLSSNVSFGRDVTQKSKFCYFAYATPGYSNVNECFRDLRLGEPKFSHDSGVYDESFILEITPKIKGSRLIYTLDGSFPDLVLNPENTFIYKQPIKIIDTHRSTTLSSKWYATENSTYPQRGENMIPYSGIVVRAKTEFSSENSAFFIFSNLGEITLPIISLTMENNYLIDPETGLYTGGSDYENYLKSADYDESLTTNFPANFLNRGIDWERPLKTHTRNAVIFHYCNASKCLKQNIGVRIHGATTRRNPMKSLRLYAREEYGKPYFEGKFFKDQRISRFKRLLLRSSGQDWGVTLLANGTYHTIAKSLDVETQNYQPTVLFINGEYWGIHNLRERYDRFYFSEKYNVKFRRHNNY
jgi:hypothetical protein